MLLTEIQTEVLCAELLQEVLVTDDRETSKGDHADSAIAHRGSEVFRFASGVLNTDVTFG